MRGVCTDYGASIEAFEADGDHVHLLLAWPPQVALSRRIAEGCQRAISASAELARGEITPLGGHFWSPSYCIVSCGGAPLEIIRAYVEGQADPNRMKTGALRRADSRRKKREMMGKKEEALTPT